MDAREVLDGHELMELECLARYAQTKSHGRFLTVTVSPSGFADAVVEVGEKGSDVRFVQVSISESGVAEAFAC